LSFEDKFASILKQVTHIVHVVTYPHPGIGYFDWASLHDWGRRSTGRDAQRENKDSGKREI
jgi:hypothetical protein